MHTQTHPTFAYTHPTSHTNTLNHYLFILKKNKNKDKTNPHYKISNHSNKKIKKILNQTTTKTVMIIKT